MVVRMYLCRKHINKTSSLLTHSPQQIPPWQLIKRDVCVELMPETVDPADHTDAPGQVYPLEALRLKGQA